jgi:hypothetical protein
MNWQDFAQAAPELARQGEERLERTGLCLVGSICKDGTPRISPVEPLIVGGWLQLGMMWRSRKALDLLRDPRCLVHSTITDRAGNEGEFKLRGRAIEITDLDARERYCVALFNKIAWRPQEPEFHVFSLDIEHAVLQWFEKEKRFTHVWSPGREVSILA